MVRVTIKTKLNFPSFSTIQDDLETVAKQIIIPDIQRGIEAGLAIDGGALPENEPSTIARKLAKGHGSMPLTDTGTLRTSFISERSGQSKVIIRIASIRSDIGAWLQGGIRCKRGLKRYKFFGISREAEDDINTFIKQRITEAINRARQEGTENSA